MNHRIYVASKASHRPMWRCLRDDYNLPIVASWIDTPDDERDLSAAGYAGLWEQCLSEVVAATAVVAYYRVGEDWKGVLVEIGAALGQGIPIHMVGSPGHSWENHPLVYHWDNLTEAFTAATIAASAVEDTE